MKETKRKIIEGKVFTKNDIRNIWKVVNEEYTISKQNKNHVLFELELNCKDWTSYESESDDLLNDGDIIDTRKCISISIEYHDYDLDRRISTALKHGNNNNNGLLVSGLDRNWVAGTFDKIYSIVDSAKPQEHWFIQYKSLILHIGALIFGFLLVEISDILFSPFVDPVKNPSEKVLEIRNFLNEYFVVKYIIIGILYWSGGIFPILFIRDWVLKLWPSVEFDFGPEHQKSEKNKRIRIGLFFLAIIIPLLVNFIYDLLMKLR